MKTKVATFENTVGILVKAYLDGTLLKGDCCACAVGNICAASLGYEVFVAGRNAEWSESTAAWGRVFMTDRNRQLKDTKWLKHKEVARQITATGYDWKQLARIEYAFETAAAGIDDQAEFAGLMAVVDVLADIHGIDLVMAEASKLLFVKA